MKKDELFLMKECNDLRNGGGCGHKCIGKIIKIRNGEKFEGSEGYFVSFEFDYNGKPKNCYLNIEKDKYIKV